jgi:hypothetical protein
VIAADALGLRSRLLSQQGHYAEGLASLDELLARYGTSPEPRLRERAAHASVVKVSALLHLGRVEEAIAVGDALAARLDAMKDPQMLAELGTQLHSVASRLARHGEHEPALNLFRALLGRLNDATEAALRRLAARAQMNEGACLAQLGLPTAANAAYEALLAFGEDALPAFDKVIQRAEATPSQLAAALVQRAAVLESLDRHDEALADVDGVIERFGSDVTPPMPLIVQGAQAIRRELLADEGSHRAAHRELVSSGSTVDGSGVSWATRRYATPRDFHRSWISGLVPVRKRMSVCVEQSGGILMSLEVAALKTCGPSQTGCWGAVIMCRVPCVFCRRNGPLSEEHVIPRWAQEYVKDPQNGPGTHTRRLYEPGRSEAAFDRSYAGYPATQVTRCACQECNNGWMASLEGTVKPLLVPMIRGHLTVLDTAAQALVTSWLIKTALVAGSTLPEPVPSEFYTSFFGDPTPTPTTRAWLASAPYEQHHQQDFRPIRTHWPDDPLPPAPNSYSAMVVIGQWVGFVVSWRDVEPPIERVEERFAPALIRIWPVSEPDVRWPPKGGALDFANLDGLADTVAPLTSGSPEG